MGNKIDYVIDNVYIGDIEAARDLQVLSEYKITRVINCAEELACPFPNEITYLKLELIDYPMQKIDDCFENAHKFIKESPKDSNVLIHCMAGISRSATITISYLMKVHSLSLEDAYDLLKRQRSNIKPNLGFMRQLQDYERLLIQEKITFTNNLCAENQGIHAEDIQNASSSDYTKIDTYNNTDINGGSNSAESSKNTKEADAKLCGSGRCELS